MWHFLVFFNLGPKINAGLQIAPSIISDRFRKLDSVMEEFLNKNRAIIKALPKYYSDIVAA